MPDINNINEALQAGYNLKINKGSKGITFELKSIFSEMAQKGLIKDKDGKGLTKQDALNMYAKLNEIHKATGKTTDYSRIQAGQAFNYTADELIQLAEASGYEILQQAKAPEQPEEVVKEVKPAPSEAKPDSAETVDDNIYLGQSLDEVVIVAQAKPKKPVTEAPKPAAEKPQQTDKPPASAPQNKFAIGRIATPFEQATMDMLYTNTNVRTNFLRQANSLLGTVEYTRQSELTTAEKQRTQAGIIGRYGNSNHQWCAHTVSTIAERSGVKIGGHYAQVQQFINWGERNGIYNKVPEMAISAQNFEDVRAGKAESISEQLPNMNEGDLIIWKSPYAAKTDVGVKLWAASHIGILESVDVEKGTITVLEGNANIPKSDDKYERYVVQNASQGVYGDQVVGEPVELNRTDGLIRKVYTIDELAKFGYSGFINMQSCLS